MKLNYILIWLIILLIPITTLSQNKESKNKTTKSTVKVKKSTTKSTLPKTKRYIKTQDASMDPLPKTKNNKRVQIQRSRTNVRDVHDKYANQEVSYLKTKNTKRANPKKNRKVQSASQDPLPKDKKKVKKSVKRN